MDKNCPSLFTIIHFISILLASLFAFYLVKGNYPEWTYSGFQDYLLYLLLFSLILEITFRLRGKQTLPSKILQKVLIDKPILQDVLLMAFSVFLCYLMLFEKWTSVYPGQYSIYNGYFSQGGYIPYSDALGYLWSIQTFNDFGQVVSASVYRPIGTLFYACIYKMAGSDLITFFYILTFLLSFSIYVVSAALHRSLGFTAGLLMAFLLCQYSLSFIGTTMTENAGLIFGNVALALMWKGVAQKKHFPFYAGLFLCALALQMRTGAMFLLPCIIIFSGLFFNVGRLFISIKHLFISSIIIICASYSTNAVLGLLEKKPKAISNIGYVLYQLHVGSSTWSQINADHPEFNDPKLSNEENVQNVNEYAINLVKEDPFPMINTIITLYKRVLSEPISFLYHFNYIISKNKIISLFLLSFLVLLFARNSGEKWLFYFLLLATVGIFASSPFLEEVRVRVYAATIAFNCVYIAIGIAMFQQAIVYLANKWFSQKSPQPAKITAKNRKQRKKTSKPKSDLSLKNLFLPSRSVFHFEETKDAVLIKSQDKKNKFSELITTVSFYFYPAIIALIALCGPVIIDAFRKEKGNYNTDSVECPKNKFLLDIKSSPWLKIISDEQRSYSPNIKNMAVFGNNSPRGIKPMEDFYLVAGINQLNYKDMALIYFNDNEFEKHLNDYALICVDTIKGDGNLLYFGQSVKYLPK